MLKILRIPAAIKLGGVLVMCLAASSCVWMAPVSVTSTGVVAGAVEDDSGISGDGRYVVFTTAAALVSSDTNSIADIYRYDTLYSKVLLVSATADGNGGNAASKQPSISGDGTRVAFASAATNFGTAANGRVQIYVRDIPSGITKAASVVVGYTTNPGNADSAAPSISTDGSMVTYSSEASNLVPSDTNGVSDIYTRVISSRVLARLTVGVGGAPANGPSTEPRINSDGSVIAFTSEASNLVNGDGNGVADVFTASTNGSIERISTGVFGEGDGPSGQPSIASLSNVVSFSSDASNLVYDDTNGVSDIFVHAPGSQIQRIAQPSGAEFLAASSAPSISSDGTRVAFLTDGTNIGHTSEVIAVVADLVAPSLNALSTLTNGGAPVPATYVSVSADGGYASFNSIAQLNSADTNTLSDVAAKFAYTTQVWPWSLSPGKVQAGTVTPVTISGDDFRVDGALPIIWVAGSNTVTFSNVAVPNAHTITATMSIPASVAANQYQIWVKTPGGGPGPEGGSTQFCMGTCLTVANPDLPADLVDIAASIGIPSADTTSYGILVDDLNQDGFDDFLFIRHAATKELLFLGDGQSVTLTPVMQLEDRHECDSADVNNDGRTDVYCSIGAGKGEDEGVGLNDLWLQQADGTYIDEAAAWGVTDPYGRGREVVFLYANNDGLPDLFVSNWGPRTDGHSTANHLFLNSGGTSFSAAPDFGVDAELPSFCARSADFDNDGDDDLIVCGGDGHVRMYANQAGAGFVDVAAAMGFTKQFLGVDFADIDGDGDLDIAFATGTSFEIHRLEQGVDAGVVFFQSVQSGKSVAFGDINGDGRPDAYFVQRGCRTELEQNLPDILAVNQGAAFTILNPPATARGCGDAVAAFDVDGDGTDGFLVGNGRGRPGPLQYLVLP